MVSISSVKVQIFIMYNLRFVNNPEDLAQLIRKQQQNAPENLLGAFQKRCGWLGYRYLVKNIVLALIRGA